VNVTPHELPQASFDAARKPIRQENNCTQRARLPVDCGVGPIDITPHLGGEKADQERKHHANGGSMAGETDLKARARSPAASALMSR
jgi:hypothetical protein